MTFREKLAKEHPSSIGDDYCGGCAHCPRDYGYEEGNSERCEYISCRECWDREIPEEETKKTESDNVNHPNHYGHGMECFDEFEIMFGTKALLIACVFNIWKYRKRAIYKNGIEDMDKSDVYLQKAIECKNKIDSGEYKSGILSFVSEFPFM